MIHFLCGKPGGGKGLVAMREIVEELVHGDRVIVTDLPIRMGPWLRNVSLSSPWGKTRGEKYQPEIGLLGYLREKYGDTFRADERIFLLPEVDAKEFYLRRYDVEKGEWVELEAERDDKGRVTSFDTVRQTYGCLYVTDECWRTFGARQWQETGAGVLFYAAQHRKFGDEWFIVCQHTKQIDVALRQVAQDYWVVRNHGKLKLGVFRQPDMFSVAIFDSPPTGAGGVAPMERRFFRLDKRGLGSCYDTAAGTGVVGGRAADLNEKRRGLPFVMFVAFLVLVMAGFWFAPKLIGKSVGKLFVPDLPVVTNSVPAVVHSPLPSSFAVRGSAATNNLERLVAQAVAAALAEQKAEVLYTGYFFDGKQIKYFLSDGSTRIVRNEFRRDGDFVVIDGERYKCKREAKFFAQPECLPTVRSDSLVNWQVGEANRESPVVDVTVIGRRPEPVERRDYRETVFRGL